MLRSTKYFPVPNKLLRFLIEHRGITEADIRDCRQNFMALQYEVRMWNHLKEIVNVEELDFYN